MILLKLAAGVLAALVFTARAADAQQAPVISLTPDDPARWDVSAHVGWFGGNKTEVGRWNGWYDAGAFGGSVGYYWTPHLKGDVELATTTEGAFFAQEVLEVPGQPFPVFRSSEHFLRVTTLAGGVAYQLLENSWFHPFAGGGLELGRETARIETPPQFTSPRDGGPPVLQAAPGTERATSSWARPFLGAGFKWYLSPRAFVRSDLRASLSTRQVESVVWRIGAGADF